MYEALVTGLEDIKKEIKKNGNSDSGSKPGKEI